MMAPVLDLIKPCVLPGVPGLVPVLMAVLVVVLWLALALAVCKPRTSVLRRLPLQIVMVVNFPSTLLLKRCGYNKSMEIDLYVFAFHCKFAWGQLGELSM